MTVPSRVPVSPFVGLVVGVLMAILFVMPAGVVLASSGEASSEGPIFSYDARSAPPTYSFNPRTATLLGERFATSGSRSSAASKSPSRAPAEIDKGITSIERQIAEHENAIANPKSKIPKWNELDPRQQEALVNRGWPGDITRQREQLDILQRLRQGG